MPIFDNRHPAYFTDNRYRRLAPWFSKSSSCSTARLLRQLCGERYANGLLDGAVKLCSRTVCFQPLHLSVATENAEWVSAQDFACER